ncbi:MAG TPA: sigma-70 family RNA polymerase sigma factor [Chitinophagaceae bacterium]|jgi:RNA polymerase sigma-70 factor (ECF subfamily)
MKTEQGNENFLKLISENKGIIVKICNSYCYNKVDREDLAQEIMYVLWKGYKTYNPAFKFSTWMYRVALNVAISFYRATKKLDNNISLADISFEIENKMNNETTPEENVKTLQKEISLLNEFDKALVMLYFEEKSYKEIAEIMGISETNVATKVNRIKKRLKQNITNAIKR